MATMATNSYFITMEGTEASGKTSQTIIIEAYLRNVLGMRVIKTREPGGTEVAEDIRNLLLHKKWLNEEDMDPKTEALLFAAARAEHVEKLIKPQLAIPHTIVLSDRYVDSSIIYQGYCRELGLEEVKAINEHAINGLYPDLTFCMIIKYEEVLKRKKASNSQLDRIEAAGAEFHNKVYDGYLKLSEIFSERIRLIDATQSIDEISQKIIDEILKKLKLKIEPIDNYFNKLSNGQIHILKDIIDGYLINLLKEKNKLDNSINQKDITEKERELFLSIINNNLYKEKNKIKLSVIAADDCSEVPNPITTKEINTAIKIKDYEKLSYYFIKLLRFFYNSEEIDTIIEKCANDFITTNKRE